MLMIYISFFYKFIFFLVLHKKRRRGKYTAVGPYELLKACQTIVQNKGKSEVNCNFTSNTNLYASCLYSFSSWMSSFSQDYVYMTVVLLCKDKIQYLLTCKVSSYCLLALQCRVYSGSGFFFLQGPILIRIL